MMRNPLSRFWMIPAAALLTMAAASAQTKVAVIDMQKALLDTAEIKKASAALEAKYKPRQSQMEKVRKDLEDIQQKLQSLAGKLTPQAEAEMTAQGQRKQRDLQRLGEDLQADVDAERGDILNKAGTRLREVVKKLAEEKGLDMVVDASNTIYFKAPLELTKDATEAYDKAYPVK